jgi:hypothetical protein
MYMINTILDDYNKKNKNERQNSFGCMKDLDNHSLGNYSMIIDDYCENLKRFENRMRVILNIQFGEKIGKSEDHIYYIFNNSYFQQMTRWWYNENRFNTYTYVQQDLDEFTRYLEGYYNNVLLADSFKKVTINKGSSYRKLRLFNNNISNFIKQLVMGIYTLKRTYQEATMGINILGTKEGDDKAKEIVELIDHKIHRMLYYKNLFIQTFQ